MYEKLETISVPEVARILRKSQSHIRWGIEHQKYPFGECSRTYTPKSPNGRRVITIYRPEFEAYLQSIKRGDRNSNERLQRI